MALSNDETRRLLDLVRRTREHEIDCDECLASVAEFAERKLVGRSIPEGLRAVEHHLAICAECCEEYAVLKRVLEYGDG